MTAEVEDVRRWRPGRRVCALAGARHRAAGAGDETRPGVHAPRGQVAKQEIYLNRNAALEAAGLSE